MKKIAADVVTTEPVDFEDAIAFFGGLAPFTKDEWNALTAEAREQAFTVAGVADVDVVRLLWDSVDEALRQGTDLDDFKAAVGEVLENAWSGTVADPGWRLQTIFRTNTQRAYSAGRYKEATSEDARAERPVWLYDAITDRGTCDECDTANGTQLPADDPFWQNTNPPIHHNCRCTVITLTEEQSRKMGGVTPRAPKVNVDEGFGRPEGGVAGAWRPNPIDYPTPLRPFLPRPPTPPAAVAPTAAPAPTPAPTLPPSAVAPPPPAASAPTKKLRKPRAPKPVAPPAPPPSDGLQVGKHVGKVTGPKKYAAHAQRALDSIVSENLQAVLEKHQLGELAVTKSAGKHSNGTYARFGDRWDPTARTRIKLTAERLPGTFGHTFEPGKSFSISSAAATEDEAILRTFIHELGHHLHLGAGASNPRVDAIVRRAWHTRASNAVNPITVYAGANAAEYFAESWTAWNFESDALKAQDPGAYQMVEDVLRCLGVPI